MKRPDNVDIWDGTDYKVNDTLTEEEKEELIKKALEEVRKSLEQEMGLTKYTTK